MATRKHPSRFRAIRPSTESLEGRQLLSGVASGVDSRGNAFVLRLVGPGTIRVTKQPDASGDPTTLTDRTDIASITLAGTDPLATRLVGQVTPASGTDGRVFFQTLEDQSDRALNGTALNGLLSIDMPNFWLGLTASAAPTTPGGDLPSITLADGVSTLRFGGVDTTAFFGSDPTRSLANNGQSDQLRVSLGAPRFAGTRIIIDRSVSNSVAPTGTATAATQDGVTFTVVGRLGIFQANEIVGSTTNAPGRFAASGGTLVDAVDDQTGLIGPIGFVRIGTNATNFSVTTSDKVRDFFVGGETNNVSLLAVNGSRNLYFGKGMDTVQVLTHTISVLKANRGAVGSEVVSDRQIGNVQFGGDLIDTTIRSGYNQNLATVLRNPSNPPENPNPQQGGQIRINVAGNVTNSVVAASTDPGPDGVFGTTDQRFLPFGTIKARIEGSINNADATPDSPNRAFYANRVQLTQGPVVPPNVPEAPFRGPLQPASLPGVPNPYVSNRIPRGPARRN